MMESEISPVGLERKIGKDDFHTYQIIRDIITIANVPASSRKVDVNIARHPSFTMDHIVVDLIGVLNRHWCKMFYVSFVNWVDLDDVKLMYGSPKWKLYGCRMMTTKK